MQPDRYYTYSDITLIPKFSSLKTRANANTSAVLQKVGRPDISYKFALPVIPANMACTIGYDQALILDSKKYMYSMHRFGDSVKNTAINLHEHGLKIISVSVGVNNADMTSLTEASIDGLHIDIITLDIAHGHSAAAGKAVEIIKAVYPDAILIAGNVATFAGYQYLANRGVDAVKVGIGQGAACSTKDKTGFTLPMFTCIQNINNGKMKSSVAGGSKYGMAEKSKLPAIIADGGCKCNGDIAKAMVAGASFVMMGSQFASCLDSPSKMIKRDGAMFKEYYGSASIRNKPTSKNIEGLVTEIPCNIMTYLEKMKEIKLLPYLIKITSLLRCLVDFPFQWAR